MSRMFALFVVDDLPTDYQILLRDPNLLVNHPNSDDVIQKLVWCRLGETAETSIGENVPLAFSAIMGYLSKPQKLNDILEQQILSSLVPASALPSFSDEPTGFVCDAEDIRPFLEKNKSKRLSYFWL